MKLIKKLAVASAILIASSVSAQEHPKSSTPFSEGVTEAYLAIQESLARDDLSGANEAALYYIAAFERSDAGLNVENLTRFADAIAAAPDLQTARESFKALSKQAILLFDYFATNESRPLYLVRCGMAFGGKGAEWIQGSEQVANPYFGAEMRSCGSILRKAGETTASFAASESGCDHGDDSAQSCEQGNSGSCCSK